MASRLLADLIGNFTLASHLLRMDFLSHALPAHYQPPHQQGLMNASQMLEWFLDQIIRRSRGEQGVGVKAKPAAHTMGK